jgi:hypothetical protein
MSEASVEERKRLEELLGDLERIHGAMLRLEDDFAAELEHVDESYRESARNLLHYLVANADLVGMSFVRRPQDVRALQAQLERLGGRHLGIVLKIERAGASSVCPTCCSP